MPTRVSVDFPVRQVYHTIIGDKIAIARTGDKTQAPVLSPKMKHTGGICLMQYARPAPEDYTRHYIVTALFKLMHEYEYEKIAVTDIVRKAGVGRATFYRYFRSKEDVIVYYFEHNTCEFVFARHIYPRCREDYVQVVTDVLALFQKQKEPFKLIKQAHLSDLYLDFLNQNFARTFEEEHPGENPYLPYLYAGMLYNVSMKWLEGDCCEEIGLLAELIVDAIYTRDE